MAENKILPKAVERANELRAELCSQAKGVEDLIAVAAAFTIMAEKIYVTLQGNKGAAMQFYSRAEYLATKTDAD